jgi:hypothetical protein
MNSKWLPNKLDQQRSGFVYGAVLNLKVQDYYPSGKRFFLRFKEKGGKEKELLECSFLFKRDNEFIMLEKGSFLRPKIFYENKAIWGCLIVPSTGSGSNVRA